MPGLAIIWHSRTGAAQAMALAACDGAGDDARLMSAPEASWERLVEASGYLFICPENLGSMSGMMKEMFDRAYYPLLGHIEGRAYATAIAAGSDGHGAQRQIDRIVTGWRLRRVADPLVINLAAQLPASIVAQKQVCPSDLERCRVLGMAMASGLRLGVF